MNERLRRRQEREVPEASTSQVTSLARSAPSHVRSRRAQSGRVEEDTVKDELMLIATASEHRFAGGMRALGCLWKPKKTVVEEQEMSVR